MSRFTLPRDIFFGPGSLSQLKELPGKRAFIVTGGSSMQRFGFLDKAKDYLSEASMEVQVFEGVEPDPSIETVMKGAEEMGRFRPDWIIAIGGGSPIDAAKAMWIFYEHPEFTFDEAVRPFNLPRLRQKARLCAVASTSGTATEVTAFSVITDYQKGIKYPLADYNLTPDVAIVDPELAQTMPPELTAHTGMDALTHAIEAYVSTGANDFTDPLALKAIEMIKDNLIKSYNGDKCAREKMHYAQCLAGMAFTNGMLGIVHSMAHKTGAAFETGHIAHGLANAMFLPYVITYNAEELAAAKRYEEIADYLRIEGSKREEKIQRLCHLIFSFNEAMGIPATLKEAGVDEEEFLRKQKDIARNAVSDACTGSNPRVIDDAKMEKLLECVYYGKKVAF